MTAPPAPPTFASLEEHVSRLGDIGFWWPYVAARAYDPWNRPHLVIDTSDRGRRVRA